MIFFIRKKTGFLSNAVYTVSKFFAPIFSISSLFFLRIELPNVKNADVAPAPVSIFTFS